MVSIVELVKVFFFKCCKIPWFHEIKNIFLILDKCFFNVDCLDDRCCEFKYGPLGLCVANIASNECFKPDSNEIYNKKYDELIFSEGSTPISNLQLSCNKTEDCSQVANSICPEFRKECTCKDGFVYQESTNSCVPGIKIINHCKTNKLI